MNPRKPKILIFDLETSALTIRAYGTYQTNAIDIVRQSHIYCGSYKWLGEKTIHCIAQSDFPARFKNDPYDDYDVVKGFHDLVMQADIVLGYNVNGFDDKVLNTRFLFHGLEVPPPHKSIDPLTTARRKLKLPNNKLQTVAQYFSLGSKSEFTHSDLWKGCEAGDKKSWQLMKKYCDQDVQLVEDVYIKLRPLMTTHPNLANITQRIDACPQCLGTNLNSNGYRTTQTMSYRRLQCQDCGTWIRERLQDRDMGMEKPTYTN